MLELTVTENNLSTACNSCGLFNEAKSYKLQFVYDTRTDIHLKNKPTILIVGKAPTQEDDAVGRLLSSEKDPSTIFLRQFLDCLDVRYVYTNGNLCYGGKCKEEAKRLLDYNPSNKQIDLCSDEFLKPWILENKPRMIVCLGLSAVRAVFGKKAPKTISSINKYPVIYPGLENTYVIATHHPVNHCPQEYLYIANNKNKQDLTQEYIRIFELAEKVSTEGLQPFEINYKIIKRPYEALALIPDLPERLYVDFEWTQSKDPDKVSVYHPGSKMLTCQFSYFKGEETHTVVLAGDALKKEILDRLFYGKTLKGFNYKSDTQAAKELLGTDFLGVDYESGIDIEDNQWDWYLPDQDQLNNDLKSRAMDLLFVPDWSLEVWNAVDEANKTIQANVRRVKKENNLRIKIINKLKNNIRLTHSELQKINALGFELETFEDRRATFEDIDFALLADYGAKDAWATAKTSKIAEIRPPEEQPHPIIKQLVKDGMKCLCRVERRGLPADKEHLMAVLNASLVKIARFKRLLLEQPEILKALSKVPKVWEQLSKIKKSDKKLTYDYVLKEWLKVKDQKFYETLLEELCQKHLVPLTEPTERCPSGQLKKTVAVIKELAAVKEKTDDDTGMKILESVIPDEERTRANDIWRAFITIRKMEDKLSRIKGQYLKYLVDGRLHTDFVLVKSDRIRSSKEAGSDSASGGAQSGRMSSRAPQLHNIQKEKVLRSCFRAPKGFSICEIDFSSGEPVVLAVLSGCKEWKTAFMQDLPFYEYMANQLFGCGIQLTGNPELDRQLLQWNKEARTGVNPDLRAATKTRTLAVMYGESAESAAFKSGVPVEEIYKFMAMFKAHYPEIIRLIEETHEKIKRGEKLITAFHRGRLFTGAKNVDPTKIFRQGFNILIQSVLSDLCLYKLVSVFRFLDKEKLTKWVHPINVVHDAIYYEIRDDLIEEILPQLINIMQIDPDNNDLPFKFDIWLRVAAEVGKHLGAMKKWKPGAIWTPDQSIKVVAQNGL